ncbi:MAG: hypothetical protein U1F41_05815 [Burkholderiales bacterium]
MKLLHAADEARKMLSLGKSKFYEEVKAGRLTIVKAGAKSLVPQSSIDSYIDTLIAEAGNGMPECKRKRDSDSGKFVDRNKLTP